MKHVYKIFSMSFLILLMLLCDFSVTQAQSVRLIEMKTTNYINVMRSNLYIFATQKTSSSPLVLHKVTWLANKGRYECTFGRNANENLGEIAFATDNQGYLQAVAVGTYRKNTVSQEAIIQMVAATALALGMTESELRNLENNMVKSSSFYGKAGSIYVQNLRRYVDLAVGSTSEAPYFAYFQAHR